MDFFSHNVSIDWMGKAKYFVGMSLALLIIGAASLIQKGGPEYSVDFKGGTLVYVRFAGNASVDQLRRGLVQQGLGDSVIQQTSDIANPNSNEVMIYLPQRGQGEQADLGMKGHRLEKACLDILFINPQRLFLVLHRLPPVRQNYDKREDNKNGYGRDRLH